MATQEEYEAIVSIKPSYRDFKITSRDLPTTEGRLENYLSERNIPTKNFRLILILVLVMIPLSTIFFFVFNNSVLDLLKINAQEISN